MNIKEFNRLVLEHFTNIIEKYEMVKCNRKATSNKLTVRFKNNTTGINITIDDRDGILQILLCKIVDNNFPTYKFGTNSNEIFNVTINDYVFVKTGILFVSNQDLISELKQSAALIGQYGAPLLSGDFSSFHEIRKLYEQRIQQFETVENSKKQKTIKLGQDDTSTIFSLVLLNIKKQAASISETEQAHRIGKAIEKHIEAKNIPIEIMGLEYGSSIEMLFILKKEYILEIEKIKAQLKNFISKMQKQ